MIARARVALVVAVAVLVVPTFLDEAGVAGDDFPHSTYPMFAVPRGRVTSLDTVVGIDAQGQRRHLSPHVIAGTDQVLTAAAAVAGAIADGTAPDLCERAAQRLGAGAGIDRLEVVVERYDAVAWYGGDQAPLAREVVATCEVGP